MAKIIRRKVNYISHIVLGLTSLTVIIPFLYLISISLSEERDIALFGYKLIPLNITFEAYKWIFSSSSQLLQAYWVSIKVTVFGVGLAVFLMSMAATAIARKDYKFRKPVMWFFLFTMMFRGGLVPEFINMTRTLGLYDNLLALILPLSVTAWFLFLIKSYIGNVPMAMIESAKIDGASEFTIYLKIIMPMSKTGIAAVALLIFMTYWNDWVRARLFIETASKVPLQYWMMRVMENVSFLLNSAAVGDVDVSKLKIPTESARMAMAVLAAGPVLFIFPFFQKYFSKGIQVGAVKG
jgi:putative aldouronate transport system permease protein